MAKREIEIERSRLLVCYASDEVRHRSTCPFFEAKVPSDDFVPFVTV